MFSLKEEIELILINSLVRFSCDKYICNNIDDEDGMCENHVSNIFLFFEKHIATICKKVYTSDSSDKRKSNSNSSVGLTCQILEFNYKKIKS